jgi:hypothetical protein
MKQIGFVTKNKVLAQSLAAFVKNSPHPEFEPFLLLNPQQAAIDADVLKIDIAVVEMIAGTKDETGAVLELCKELRHTVPDCQILLFIPQDNKVGRDTGMKAVRDKIVDDYVFFDNSLNYLVAKLLAM